MLCSSFAVVMTKRNRERGSYESQDRGSEPKGKETTSTNLKYDGQEERQQERTRQRQPKLISMLLVDGEGSGVS